MRDTAAVSNVYRNTYTNAYAHPYTYSTPDTALYPALSARNGR